jgi:hypothetical protein
MLKEVVSPMPKPSAREVRLLHEAVKELTERLYRDRFDAELVWDKGDDLALDRYLALSVNKFSPWPSVEEIESLLRAYFASDGIQPDRPYLWLENLGKYRPGPLDKSGVPKSLVAAQRAEVDETIAASIREAEARKAAAAAADRSRLVARLVIKVAEDLRSRGFEVFRPVSDVSHIVATLKSASTRNCAAIRIICRASIEELTRNTTAFYQAIADPNQDLRVSSVAYYPPLEIG